MFFPMFFLPGPVSVLLVLAVLFLQLLLLHPGAVQAQERLDVINEGTQDNPGTQTLSVAGGGRAVNPAGGRIVVDGVNGIAGGDSTPESQTELINAGAIEVSNSNGIQGESGSRVSNTGQGMITTTGQNAHGIRVTDGGSTVTNEGTVRTMEGFSHGIHVTDGGSSTVTNEGTVRTTEWFSHGIHVLGGHNAITNQGTISTTGRAGSCGIRVQGDDNTLTNEGEITTAGTESYGIRASGNNTIIINEGEITTADQSAYGIRVDDGSGNSITNRGTITTRLFFSDGIHALGGHNTVTNEGEIITAERDADGIRAQYGGSNTIVNQGTITTEGPRSFGIRGRNGDNIITNEGMITTGGQEGDGIHLVGGTNTITNRGMLITTGEASDAIQAEGGTSTVTNEGMIITTEENSVGIMARDGGSNTIINQGAITTEGPEGDGISISDGNNIITNRGMISTTGPEGDGISVSDGHNTITNWGRLTTTGEGASALQAEGGNNTITNQGMISTTEEDSVGIMANGAGNRVVNRGMIVALQSEAIQFDTATSGNRLILGEGSFLVGGIDLGAGTHVTVDLGQRAGLSSVWRLTGTLNDGEGNGAASAADLAVSGGVGNTVFVPAAGDNPGRLALVDPTLFVSTSDILAGVSALSSRMIEGRLSGGMTGVLAGDLSGGVRVAAPGSRMRGFSGLQAWSGVMGGGVSFGRRASENKTIHGSFGSMTGLDYTPAGGSVTGGGFVGYVRSTMAAKAPVGYRSFEREGRGVVGGVYGHLQRGPWFGSLVVSGGSLNSDQTRMINDSDAADADAVLGLTVATSEETGPWISPELRVGYRHALGGDWELIPQISVRYGVQWLSGYTEREANAQNGRITVGSRTVDTVGVRAELAALYPLGERGSVLLRAGYGYRDSPGEDQAKVTVLGQETTVAINQPARHRFLGGVDLEFALNERFDVQVGGHFAVGADHGGGGGNLSLRMAF